MSLLELCVTVLVYNAVTFGNGPVMVPLLQADLVEGRGVLSSDQLLYGFTIARITPGQANTYVAAIGYMLHGLVGALACTVAIVLPGYLMLPLLWGYQRLRGVHLIPAFTRGLTIASVGLIFAATLSIGRATLTGWVSAGGVRRRAGHGPAAAMEPAHRPGSLCTPRPRRTGAGLGLNPHHNRSAALKIRIARPFPSGG